MRCYLFTLPDNLFKFGVDIVSNNEKQCEIFKSIR